MPSNMDVAIRTSEVITFLACSHRHTLSMNLGQPSRYTWEDEHGT